MLRPTAMLLAALVFVASPIGHGSSLESCTIAIDVGHTRASQGAVSARGVGAHAFNEIAASALLEELRHGGDRASFIIDGTASRSLDSRAEAAVRGKADRAMRPACLAVYLMRTAQTGPPLYPPSTVSPKYS
jgi:N-acetylmuramoyl-L-alanine amidase